MHHSGHLHLTQDKDGLTILNAEDFYAALVLASKRYFGTVKSNTGSAPCWFFSPVSLLRFL